MLLSLSHSPGKTHLRIYVLSVGQLCFEVPGLLILCSSTPTYLVKRAGVAQNLYKSLLAPLDAKYSVAYKSQVSTSRDPSCLTRIRWLLLLLMEAEYQAEFLEPFISSICITLFTLNMLKEGILFLIPRLQRIQMIPSTGRPEERYFLVFVLICENGPVLDDRYSTNFAGQVHLVHRCCRFNGVFGTRTHLKSHRCQRHDIESGYRLHVFVSGVRLPALPGLSFEGVLMHLPQMESTVLAAVCAQIRQASNLSHLGFGRHRK